MSILKNAKSVLRKATTVKVIGEVRRDPSYAAPDAEDQAFIFFLVPTGNNKTDLLVILQALGFPDTPSTTFSYCSRNPWVGYKFTEHIGMVSRPAVSIIYFPVDDQVPTSDGLTAAGVDIPILRHITVRLYSDEAPANEDLAAMKRIFHQDQKT